MGSWTTKQIALAVLMVITGSLNTLSTKWADTTKAVGSDNGSPREFNHPFLQALGMFLGESTCLVAFLCLKYMWRTRSNREMSTIAGTESPSVTNSAGFQGISTATSSSTIDLPPTPRFNPFVFLPPAFCDMLATSTMYVGLNMTYPSSFQMLRGALIIFTGMLSVAFLGRTLRKFQWAGILTIIVGLVIVGLSDFITSNNPATDMNAIITGDLLIIMAQVIVAVQMVVEERFVTKLNVHPLVAVGCEGLFGFTMLGILLFPMYYITVPSTFSKNPHHRLEDVPDAFVQIGNSWQIIVAQIGNILSIAFFNFAGISVTKEISATTRTVLDSIRTLVIWFFSLGIGWQSFYFLQLVGFVILVLGMFIYNDIIFAPYLRRKGWLKDEQRGDGYDSLDSAGAQNSIANKQQPTAPNNP